jgi:hypothetical protein
MIVKRRPAPKPARAPHQPRTGTRLPVALLPALLVLLVLAAVVGGLLLTRGDNPSPAAGGSLVRLAGVAAYDPDGGDGEHDDEAPFATDNNPSTYWTTSSYRSSLSAIGKSGVGLVLDAGAANREVSKITVTTDTPGFTAEIQAGNSPQGPFEKIGAGKTVSASTTWAFDPVDKRYYVVWITDLDGRAHVNEVKASN